MDVNGTKYHLLYNCNDWNTCHTEDVRSGVEHSLQELWNVPTLDAPLEWDCATASLRLAREVPLFRQKTAIPPLDISTRRGAGCDVNGNWYWIDSLENSILILPSGSYTAQLFWSGNTATVLTENTAPFTRRTNSIAPLLLRGLTVTTRNYLVVGDVNNSGLLVFDLSNGGNPSLMRWPKTIAFSPWSLAATLDGGLLVLDREHSTYWVFDAYLRPKPDVQDEEMLFQPVSIQGTRQPRTMRRSFHPHGYPLLKTGDDGTLVTIAAVSIQPGPDCHVLILESDPAQPYSMIYEYDKAKQLAAYSLKEIVDVMDPGDGEEGMIPIAFSILGHDFAYIADGGSAAQLPGCGCADGKGQPVIYVADQRGKQAFGLAMDRQQMRLRSERDFLPLRRWDGKGFVTTAGKVYYDYGDRWVPLMVFAECHYVSEAVLTTATNFAEVSNVTSDAMLLLPASVSSAPSSPTGIPLVPPVIPMGGPFDSAIVGCVWHRLILDAQIPPGTEIAIQARASDDADLLLQTNWQQLPDPYLRSGSAEIPYYDPWHDEVQPLPEGTGTWELLFQDIQGRYLQLELTLRGTGRSTPAIRALRAWYPRFSYLEHYLPVVYREDPLATSFLDRWLANFEGLYTNLEDKIQNSAELFDARTAPAEALPWLAGWFGLVLDPLWEEARRRLLIRHIDELYRRRGTALGVEIAVRLYVEDMVTDALFDPQSFGTGNVRIVELFSTRNTQSGQPVTYAVVASTAHRFRVVLPQNIQDEKLAMVQRIIELEKPAHTAFEIQYSGDVFSVGNAQLGRDTQLGTGGQYNSMLLGNGYLGDSYLDTTNSI